MRRTPLARDRRPAGTPLARKSAAGPVVVPPHEVINGIKLTAPIALRDGDELRIGNVPMTLKIYSKPSSTETATGY